MVRFGQCNSTDLDGHSLNWQSIAIGLILILRILQLLLLLLLLLLSWFVGGGGFFTVAAIWSAIRRRA